MNDRESMVAQQSSLSTLLVITMPHFKCPVSVVSCFLEKDGIRTCVCLMAGNHFQSKLNLPSV